MTSTNEIVIAAAGSGKTDLLIDEALADQTRSVLITTFTRENLSQIDARLWSRSGGQPHRVTTMSWFEFLLRDCVKPYQAYKTEILTIRSINFTTRKRTIPALRLARKSEFDRYYVDANHDIYQDEVSDLACVLDDESSGKVIRRLEACYDAILIDELQDLAGPDLDLLERMFASAIRILAVGDPRQAVYVTNTSNRNRQLRRAGIMDWLHKLVNAGRVTRIDRAESYRCNQPICDYADALYPMLPSTTSKNVSVVADMGVHLVHKDDLECYRAVHRPQELRWNRATTGVGPGTLNMGEVKGMGFDRVLVHPTATITDYVETGAELAGITRAKFYVAITRARHSVGIVTSKRTTASSLECWIPQAERSRDDQSARPIISSESMAA